MQIFVKMPGQTLTLEVEAETRIAEARATIIDKTGITDFWLLHPWEDLSDDESLIDHNLQPGTTIVPIMKMQVTVTTLSGNSMSIRIYLTDTVADIKSVVHERHHSWPPALQHLFIGVTELDDTRTVSECDLLPDSSLQLILE
jgi:hypothetical protein